MLKWLPANVLVPPNLPAQKPFLWAVGRSRDIAELQDLMKEIRYILGNNTSIVSTREIAKKELESAWNFSGLSLFCWRSNN